MIRFFLSLFRRRPVIVQTYKRKEVEWKKLRDKKCAELSGGREWRAR